MIRRRGVASALGLLIAMSLVAGCSGDDDAKDRGADRTSGASSGSGSKSAGATAGGSTAAETEQAAKAAKEELAAAKAASKRPSGVAGQAAPNDDDGARNLAAVDPSTGPSSQNTSGSVGHDPLESPTPTFPEPGRPDTDGLLPLDGCDEITAPFYRAVSSLNVNSSAATIVEGVKDLSTVAARAQEPIAAAVQILLTTAQAAAADAARAQEFGGEAFQAAVKTVHVYLGDTCGR